MISCQRDTPRLVDSEIFRSVFGLQEKVLDDIVRSIEEQRALQAAPRSVDPIQQTVVTIIQSYLNHLDVDRRQAIEAIRFLNQPMLAVQMRKLRQAYRGFRAKSDVGILLECVEDLRKSFGGGQTAIGGVQAKTNYRLERDDLRLICFDLVTSA